MSKYSRLLKQVNFPFVSKEYYVLVIKHVIPPSHDEVITQKGSVKAGNIVKFHLGNTVIETSKFLLTIPNAAINFPGFVVGLVEYVAKLKEYATKALSSNERAIIECAAGMFMDSGYIIWPLKEEVRERLATQINEKDFNLACDSLINIGCIEIVDGQVKIAEEVDID